MSENKYIIKKISADDTKNYNKAEKLFTASFRPCEMREGLRQRELLKRPEYELLGAFAEDELCAAAAVWRFSGFSFLEHFAVWENLRGSGLGSEMLKEIADMFDPLILETEKDMDDFSARRHAFYIRNGFSDCGISYMQPQLNKKCKNENVALTLMSSSAIDALCAVKTVFEGVYNIDYDEYTGGLKQSPRKNNQDTSY